MSGPPRIAYICDFPPSGHRGGAILLSRLFATYPAERIAVLTGSHYDRLAPSEGRLSCVHHVFPTSDKTGRWGFGRLKTILDVSMLPLVTLWGFRILRRFKAEAVVTVAHGSFFLVAGALSYFAALPLVLIVHDDWVATSSRNYRPFRFVFHAVFRRVARQAAHVYVVSPRMRDLLHSNFGIAAEFELPGTSPLEQSRREAHAERINGPLEIIYAGTLTGAMDDSLGILLRLVSGERLRDFDISDWVLHLYTPTPPEGISRRSKRVRFHGWVSPEELREAMTKASVLFLPLSFLPDQREITETSFPSKTAEYLAANTPILICAPANCAIVRYAREYGFAEIVSEPSEEALGRALSQLANSDELRVRLRRGAAVAFAKNHDIRMQRERFFSLVSELAERRAS